MSAPKGAVQLSLGINLKYVNSTLADKYSGTALAVDLGALYKPTNSILSYGISLQNIGSQITYVNVANSLPMVVRGGVLMKFRDAEIDSWLLTTDLVYYDSTMRCNAGIECTLFKTLALRAGYKLGYNPDTLTFGAGFMFSQINIDYAYSAIGGIDSVQMFTVSYSFDAKSTAMKRKEDIVQTKAPPSDANLKHHASFGKDKIAVMSLEAKSVSGDTVALITDILRNNLFDIGEYVVIERSFIDKVLKEQSLQKTGCTTTECAIEVGRILNAQQIVVGAVGKIGDNYIINVRLVDVESSEITATASEECNSVSELASACKRAAYKLSNK